MRVRRLFPDHETGVARNGMKKRTIVPMILIAFGALLVAAAQSLAAEPAAIQTTLAVLS